MYWRRFKISEIPYEDHHAFDAWVLDRWKEKDELLEGFYNSGRFPADEQVDGNFGAKAGYIETEVKLGSWLEVGQIFAVLAMLAMVANVLTKLWEMFI